VALASKINSVLCSLPDETLQRRAGTAAASAAEPAAADGGCASRPAHPIREITRDGIICCAGIRTDVAIIVSTDSRNISDTHDCARLRVFSSFTMKCSLQFPCSCTTTAAWVPLIAVFAADADSSHEPAISRYWQISQRRMSQRDAGGPTVRLFVSETRNVAPPLQSPLTNVSFSVTADTTSGLPGAARSN